MHMREVLIAYLHRVEELSYRLTHSSLLCDFSAAFMDSLKADEQRFPEILEELPSDYVNEHYRRKLRIMRGRLKMNLTAVCERMEQPDTGPVQPGNRLCQRAGIITRPAADL